MRVAIITGASSGIGMEFAKQIDQKCLGLDEIWLIARSYDKLEELSKVLKNQTRIFAMDLTDTESYLPLLTALEQFQPKVRLLINSAGYGINGFFADMMAEDVLGMIDLNCKALIKMTHLILPFMPPRSYIIQMGSSAAFMPQPKFSIYAASKAFVLSFSRALNKECKEKEISVTCVCPGPVETAFFERSEKISTDTFAFKKLFMVQADAVVKKALKDTFYGKTISVYSIPMQGMQLLTKLIPHDVILSIYSKMIL